MPTPICPTCRGKGGVRGPYGWIKCPACKPRQTRQEARDAALRRYLEGNRNELAERACMRLGYAEQELVKLAAEYDQTNPPSERSLF